ncbi:MAG: PDZ domain-containing protein [Myxococcales bacterium]|nr:PDZ domain-containing protein [Myxococcales bacterium]
MGAPGAGVAARQTEPGEQAAPDEGGDQTASAGPAGQAQDVADDDDDDDDDDEGDSDHWSKVPFDVHNFDEVLDYVATNYIDAVPDRKRAWVEAANFALLTLDPAEELVPAAFHKVRAGHIDEEGRLDGRKEPFSCGGEVAQGILLHHVPSDDYVKARRPARKKGRLSNEEVLALRAKIQDRNTALNDAWAALPFGRPQFDCVMTRVQQAIQQYHARKKAGLPPLIDDPVSPSPTTAPAELKLAPAPGKNTGGGKGSQNAKGTPEPKTAANKLKDTPSAESRALPVPPDSAAAPRPDAKPAPEAKNPKDAPRAPTADRAWVSAATGYLYALDPHSAIVLRETWDKATAQTQDNSFEGIGAVLTQREDSTIVENPMEGRPAWRAGVRAGDIIHKVDGTDVGGWLLTKVVKMIRGKKGTTVVLTISRESDPDPRAVAIVREHIEIKNVDGELLKEHPGVAHVKMAGFIPKSTSDLRDMLKRLEGQAPGGKLTGIVLDLRNNAGGLLNKAIEVADLFLTSGRIVSVKSRKKAEEVHEGSWSPSDWSEPLVVLVNDGSASASEIVASAIQDNRRGLVVGSRTFGKASVQTLFEPTLHQDYYIKLTVARYYAPSGQTIQVIGVNPDAEIAPAVDGKLPVGMREENLNNHLVPIVGTAQSPWAAQLPALQKCVTDTGLAVTTATREKNPQIHPDFQLLRAADYVSCLGRLRPATR